MDSNVHQEDMDEYDTRHWYSDTAHSNEKDELVRHAETWVQQR